MNNVNDTLKQDVSALLDGELDELGLARILSEKNVDDVRKQLRCYSVMQSVLSSEALVPKALSIDISTRVRESIEGLSLDAETQRTQPTQQQAQSHSGGLTPANERESHWHKPAAGFAIAASMAFLMVFGVTNWQADDAALVATVSPALEQGVPAHIAQVAGVNNNLDNLDFVSQVSFAEQEFNDPLNVVVAADKELRRREQLLLQAQHENAEIQRRLREYLIRHAQQNVANPVNRVVPVARASQVEYRE